MNDLRKKIESAINSTSAENGSDTPDFILAEYLTDCLAAYDKAVTAREKWYERQELPTPFPSDNTTKSVSPTYSIPQTNPAPFVSEADARVAEFVQQISAISQAHEMWLRESFTDKKPCTDRVDSKTPPQPQ